MIILNQTKITVPRWHRQTFPALLVKGGFRITPTFLEEGFELTVVSKSFKDDDWRPRAMGIEFQVQQNLFTLTLLQPCFDGSCCLEIDFDPVCKIKKLLVYSRVHLVGIIENKSDSQVLSQCADGGDIVFRQKFTDFKMKHLLALRKKLEQIL